jgi:PTS system mannose-specific IIA component
VTHGRLAAEFVTAMEHVVGPQDAIEAICIGPDDNMEGRRKDIAAAIQKVDQGQGVIILTDLFGGTPSNLAISLMKTENVEVIAGVNLPMLIRREGSGPQVHLGRERDPRRGRCLTAVSRQVAITNQRGLHARASAKFVNLASQIDAKIEVEKDGHRVCGTSIMGLMMLGAAMGDSVIIHVEGEEADAALVQLVELVDGKFGEE